MAKYIDLTLPIDGKFRFKVDFKKDHTFEKDGAQVFILLLFPGESGEIPPGSLDKVAE